MNTHDGDEIIPNLVIEVNTILGGLSRHPMKNTIFRMPAHIRKNNKELYEPRMVSIGPYYNGSGALHAMEKHKWRYLKEYLSRNTENSIENCIHALSALEYQARGCYFEEAKHPSREFLMMMLLDGCFIIEFIIKWRYRHPDIIFDVAWVLPIIRSDLLLLENQIPFFVIQKLFDLLICPGRVSTIEPLKQMLLNYLSEVNKPVDDQPFEIKHILHLYYHCYMPQLIPNTMSTDSFPQRIPSATELQLITNTMSTDSFPQTIPSATELKEVGMIFKRKVSTNIFDVTFQNGTLEIPFISIEETRRSRLLNLVSFEQCNGENNRNLTSYACFMGHLFKNARDVTLLQEMGIVDNLLATNDELVSFFNCLTECSYLDYNKHYLKELFRDVTRYYNSNWHRWITTLVRNYFSTPWSFLSFLAACFLLALTILQTVYTILPYHHRKK